MTAEGTLVPLLAPRKAKVKLRTTSDTVLRGVPSALRKVARKQILDKLSELLQVPLTTLTLDALKSWDELVDEAALTRCEPGTLSGKAMATMEFKASKAADLDIRIDSTLTTLPVLLKVMLEVRGLVPALEDGCVYQIEAGHAKITATLELSEVELASYTCTLDLAVALPLQPPLELCPPPPSPPPELSSSAVIRLPEPAATEPTVSLG